MNSFEIGSYKNELMYQLLNDNDIVRLLDPNGEFEYPDDLMYDRIFPYGRVPLTEQEVKAYITVTCDVKELARNNTMIRYVQLVVRVISHVEIMQVENRGVDRIDLIGARIDKVLNGSNNFGIGPLDIVSNKEYTLDDSHFYRELIFETPGLNCSKCR